MIKKDPRNTDLAKIHIAKKQLGMDRSTYEDMLWTVARVRSSADLDDAGRSKVLQHLRSRGFKAKRTVKVNSYPGRPHNINTNDQLKKIEALLTDLKLPWSYADSIAKRVSGVAKVAWVKESKHKQAIISALSYEQEKRNLLGQIDALLLVMNKDRAYVDSMVEHKDWTRNRPTLKFIVKTLISETDK